MYEIYKRIRRTAREKSNKGASPAGRAVKMDNGKEVDEDTTDASLRGMVKEAAGGEQEGKTQQAAFF